MLNGHFFRVSPTVNSQYSLIFTFYFIEATILCVHLNPIYTFLLSAPKQ